MSETVPTQRFVVTTILRDEVVSYPYNRVIESSASENGQLSILNVNLDGTLTRTMYAAGAWRWVTASLNTGDTYELQDGDRA